MLILVLKWARASRDSKFYKILSAKAEILELENRIEEKKSEIHLLKRDKKRAQELVDGERKQYQEEIIGEDYHQTDQRFADAFSSDFEVLPISDSEDDEDSVGQKEELNGN